MEKPLFIFITVKTGFDDVEYKIPVNAGRIEFIDPAPDLDSKKNPNVTIRMASGKVFNPVEKLDYFLEILDPSEALYPMMELKSTEESTER